MQAFDFETGLPKQCVKMVFKPQSHQQHRLNLQTRLVHSNHYSGAVAGNQPATPSQTSGQGPSQDSSAASMASHSSDTKDCTETVVSEESLATEAADLSRLGPSMVPEMALQVDCLPQHLRWAAVDWCSLRDNQPAMPSQVSVLEPDLAHTDTSAICYARTELALVLITPELLYHVQAFDFETGLLRRCVKMVIYICYARTELALTLLTSKLLYHVQAFDFENGLPKQCVKMALYICYGRAEFAQTLIMSKQQCCIMCRPLTLRQDYLNGVSRWCHGLSWTAFPAPSGTT